MMSDARAKAKAFLEQEKAFRLGELLTESMHPKTLSLSQTIQADVPAGVRMLQSVDDDIQKAAEQQAQNTRNGGLCPEIHAHQTT